MAKSTTFLATDPAGTVHKRTSVSRTYSHTVVAIPSFEHAMKQADCDHKIDGDNWEHDCKMAAWGGLYLGERKPWHTDEEVAKKQALYTERAARFSSREEAIAAARAARVAFVNERKANGYYDRWQNMGWCGRTSLATDLARRTMASPYYTKVAILVATMKA